MEFTRRTFLGTSASAVVAASTMAKGTVLGANDRIRVCCIGLNGRGGAHIRECIAQNGVEVAALCDVDERVINRRAQEVAEAQGSKPKLYADLRDVMDDDSIDAITLATPNHWHALASIWGCQAGKDVYVEKPLSHNVWEGRQLVAAAQKYGRIVQHGTQSRLSSTLMRDIQLMHDGFIGEIVHSRGYVYKNGNRHAIGHGRPGKAPDYLDWTLWQGPAKRRPYLERVEGRGGLQVHYNWHWFWEYGNGEIGNQGVHEMDIACWGHNRGAPVKVMSQGGRYGWDDDGETPNTQATSYTYADGSMLTFEVRNLGSFPEKCDRSCSNSFFGTEGYYVRGAGFFNYKNEPIPVEVEEPPSNGVFGNFFDAMRSRKAEELGAPVEAGHNSCIHIHVGNIAYRLGRSLEFDPKKERFVKDREANRYLKRDYRDGFEPDELA
ncbi:MAG: Gfo/Idh/MocA family oxidoreductase [Nitrospiraceae bacterium]|nr:Gfo/Idh/MocA family oxidoreductase [Nitrospiraceae bacterium]